MSKSCFTCVFRKAEVNSIPLPSKDNQEQRFRQVPVHRCGRDIVTHEIRGRHVEPDGEVVHFHRKIDHPFTISELGIRGEGPVLTCREMLLNGCRDYNLYEYDKRLG